MNLSDLADQVKAALTAVEVGKAIGLNPNRAGFCQCPLHGEKTGSLKLYPGRRGWYCYGCHKGGSVIDLVMEYYGLPLKGALEFLNDEFSLGLSIDGRLTREQEAEARRRAARREETQRRRKEAEKARSEAFERYCDIGQEVGRMKRDRADFAPKNADDEWDPRFVEALRKQTELMEEAEECAMLFNSKEDKT